MSGQRHKDFFYNPGNIQKKVNLTSRGRNLLEIRQTLPKLHAMSYKRLDEDKPRCLHCGAPVYGRTDKKFCSPGCKDRYNYLKKAELQPVYEIAL